MNPKHEKPSEPRPPQLSPGPHREPESRGVPRYDDHPDTQEEWDRESELKKRNAERSKDLPNFGDQEPGDPRRSNVEGKSKA